MEYQSFAIPVTAAVHVNVPVALVARFAMFAGDGPVNHVQAGVPIWAGPLHAVTTGFTLVTAAT
jgi:hypothetical protein